MSECTCDAAETSVDVEKDSLVGAYVAVKRCDSCEGEVDRVILGTSSKFTEWSEEKLLEQF